MSASSSFRYFRPVRRSTDAFTLLEMMVAVTLSLILITLMGSIVESSATVTSSLHNRLAAYHDANLAFQYLAQDFESLLPAGLAQSTLSIVPEQVKGDSGDAASSMWIVFLSRPVSSTKTNNIYLNQGVVSAISYRVAYQDPVSPSNPKPVRGFALYRSVVTKNPSSFLNQTGNTNWDLYSNYWKSYWNTYSTGGNTPLDDYLLGDVVSIQISLNYSYVPPAAPGTTNMVSVPLTPAVGEVTLTSAGFVGDGLAASGANTPISIGVNMTVLRHHAASLYQQGVWNLQKAISKEGVVISRNFPIQGSCMN